MNCKTTTVFVCTNIDCRSRGADAVLEAMRNKVERSQTGSLQVEPYLCFSACNSGPNVVIADRRSWFSEVQATDVDAIVDYLNGGDDVPRLRGKNDPELEQMIFDIIDSGLVPGAA